MNPAPIPSAVLDTNVALDWFVFADPSVRGIVRCIQESRMTWLASPSMRAELLRVLDNTCLSAWSPDRGRALAMFDRWARVCDLEPELNAAGLRPSDPDDQAFIDLAMSCRARWLITRDRALLKLARRTRPWGVQVLTPPEWHADRLPVHCRPGVVLTPRPWHGGPSAAHEKGRPKPPL